MPHNQPAGTNTHRSTIYLNPRLPTTQAQPQPRPVGGATNMNSYQYTCDTCGRVGNTDDGINDAGDDCPADDCDGTVRRIGYTTDNRWSPGASGATVPEDAPAAYSARWIDCGDNVPADVLPDRQGFAYNDPADRDRLIEVLKANDGLIRRLEGLTRNTRDRVGVNMLIKVGWTVTRRRDAGYIYVDAWLS